MTSCLSIRRTVGGLIPGTGEQYNTLNPLQEPALRLVIQNLIARHPNATVTAANALLHPDDDPTNNEPYFDVPKWWATATPQPL